MGATERTGSKEELFCAVWPEPWQDILCGLWVPFPLAGERKREAMRNEVVGELGDMPALTYTVVLMPSPLWPIVLTQQS